MLMHDHRLALERARRDGLTGLPDRSAFHDELERAVDAQRSGGPLALAVLDLDDFKLANDRYGHPHGDQLLRRVAGVLLATPGARAYRVGGDEFALLADTDAGGLGGFAAGLDGRMDDAAIPVSIGVATLAPGQAPESLHLEADAALYDAKRRRRSYERTIAG